MAEQPPKAVEAYFAAKKANDVDAMVATFGDDAVVKDEGKPMRGQAAIRKWIDDTNARYRYTVEVTGVTTTATGAIVVCRLTGSFPGSPLDVQYTFGLSEGKITSLEIN